jgi:queuine tRNA-ribosyltransferase
VWRLANAWTGQLVNLSRFGMSSPFRFELLAHDPSSGLRVGELHTPHGPIPTPAFMPVGTAATVKALTPRDVRATGARCVLANTYHLVLRPGTDTVRRLGGLHATMRWHGPILADSGGFQVFSLGGLRQITEDGVWFRSHLDDTSAFFSPEGVIAAEEVLGADLIMPLDECVGADASRETTEAALERTQRWWRRSLGARTRDDQALFALVQGGLYADLRREAARVAASEEAPGFAIGGFSVGESREVTAALLAETLAHLPPDRPRYLMGVGTPHEVLRYARMGVDLFDCVLPTRLARNGAVWTDAVAGRRLDLARRELLGESGPVLPGCPCPACTGWPLGALAALFQARDQLAYRLASAHNLTVLASALWTLRESVSRAACYRADACVVYTPEGGHTPARSSLAT